MATFKVISGGVPYKVTAPDMQSAIDAVNEMIDGAPKPAAPDPSRMAAGPVKTAETSTLGDVTKAVGSGLVTGTEALLGLPGDLMQGAHDLGGWAGRNIRSLAGLPDKPADAPALSNPVPLPTSGDVAQANNAVTGFTPYQPKTTIGKYANTAAEFIPGAVALGGAGGIARKALAYGVAPGLASEAAGQATEGTALEGPARFAGALVGGMAGGRMMRPSAAAGPTAADLKAQGRSIYKSFDTPQGQLVLEPRAFNKIANDVSSAAYKARISKASPKSLAILKEIENMGAAGVAPDILEIDGLRRQLGALAKSADGTERFMAGLMTRKLDDAMNALRPADIIAGDATDALQKITKARDLWSRGKKADIIEGILEKAQRAAGANYTSAGLMTAVKQKFRALADSRAFKTQFNADERAAIEQIIRGTTPEKIVRFLGKFDPRSPIMLSVLGGLGYAVNPALAVGTAGVGYLAKNAAGRTALRNVEHLREMAATGAIPPPRPGANLPLAADYAQNTLNRDARLRLPPLPSEMASDPLGRRLGGRP